ncbi:MAG: NAD(P)/FAD-dependent oxidoreductase [Clostridia bacterium]|nr:NAD(P)/FAD-dependent oxidoreductase [Clostridia bacterium]
MKIVIHAISMPLRHTQQDVIKAAQEIVRLRCIKATDFWIYKQSIDARKKDKIHYVYSVGATVPDDTPCDGKVIAELPEDAGESLSIPQRKLQTRPVIVGMGPCGLFAAYVLAKSGNPPLVIERGEPVEQRAKTVETFWNGGKLNPNSNIQFGEGGAGTFSDGKLNTRISDIRQRYVLSTFVAHGGPEDLLYRAKPHIGTDKLRGVIASMRQEILKLGGEIRFDTCLTGISYQDGKLQQIEINHTETLPCDCLILAIGHSSRDTYRMLEKAGIPMEPKAFAVGVRAEHQQRMIGTSQYGDAADQLPPADYRLVYNGETRSCYSFCMCPGGQVVNASSEDGCLVVNGMSNYLRDGENANSALVVSVRPEDFLSDDPLAGMEFQRHYEALAYQCGGGDGSAPVQLIRDFLKDVPSTALGEVIPSFTGNWSFAELKDCLPEFVTQTLKEGLNNFERKIKGFATGDGVLTGVEMRTSAPVRLLRGNDLQSVGIAGLYPAGEGAGYAGGIVSAAVDGIRCALQVLAEH